MARLLLVEDDRMIQRTLARFLGELGHEVEVASDGREALDRLMAGGVDLCVLDMGLPVLDGMGVMRRYAELLPDASGRATVVVVSARDDMQSTVEAVRLGAYDYLLKPVELDRLQQAVTHALSQRNTGHSLFHAIDQDGDTLGEMLGRSEAIREVFKAIGAVAATRATVLVTGEKGTGKERVARAIHRAGADAERPFVSVACGAFAREQLEAELFGQAGSGRPGRLEQAGQGTLFLDEVGELSSGLQARLLRALEDGAFERANDGQRRPLEARVVAATHRDLGRMVHDGTFRDDLHQRLRVVEITVPPLRERRDDIPALVSGFLPRLNRSLRTAVRFIRHDAMEMLLRHDWPGNVRELEGVLTRACVLAKGELIAPEHLPALSSVPADDQAAATPAALPADPASLGSLRDLEREHVARVLAATRWNKRRSCDILRITRPTLDRKIKEFGLEKPT